jgi:hypothetical protein
MATHPDQLSHLHAAHDRILTLLSTLPPEGVGVVEQCAQFLHTQARQGRPIAVVAEHETPMTCHYPTISVPAAVLGGLFGLVPPVGGDALADTEALYDAV